MTNRRTELGRSADDRVRGQVAGPISSNLHLQPLTRRIARKTGVSAGGIRHLLASDENHPQVTYYLYRFTRGEIRLILWQPPIPPLYNTLEPDRLADRIHSRKRELGDNLIILGHHYQQDDVIQFADFTGDSFKLSRLAAEQVTQSGARFVVFLGVHFMAESADILTPDSTQVILPDLGAGCSMADMADHDQAVAALEAIHEMLEDQGEPARVIPICYMNSSAAIKAFCGENGGAACTSSNCRAIFEWALAGGETGPRPGERIKILFLPDQHLGRNTAAQMGYDIEADMALWDPRGPDPMRPGGNDPQTIDRATFILWKGHCSVHKLFRPEHIDQIRSQWPGVNVMVHPECDHDVVLKADRIGSTEGIIQAINEAPAGSRWAIGTEIHMVNRLARQAAQRGVEVRILSDCQCLCTTMYRINMPHLAWVLDELAQGRVVNQIRVAPEVKHWALESMNRMLAHQNAPLVVAE
ncbi:MAG: quinolinate synthase NadA [Phycisphaeraceae bacterium]|nr:quinolinate synthase NadA [Phycisphaeraceae bacterium]